MELASFENLLKESMGLDTASIGASAIERAVRERQRICQLDDLGAYWARVCEGEAELQALIEAVVVPETWFFRDREAFTVLRRLVGREWLNPQSDDVLRLLSLPCSTGEEPYSMAMTLLDAGGPADRFRVKAVDISERVLAHGRRGVYGKSSFRGHPIDFRDRHFEPTAHGHRISDRVRRHVDFERGNLLSPTLLPGTEVYDVVFCRNVLIYFDRPTQNRAISVLSRLLAPKGLLFVGPSEAGVFLNRDFVPVKTPMAFAFRRAHEVPRLPARLVAPPARPRSPRRPMGRPPNAANARRAPTSAPAADRTGPEARMPREETVGLDEATRLANQGRFVEAAICCEEHARRHGPSAEAFYLLGLVRDACGSQSEAAIYYRKALYLEPHHQEALVHLALLMEKLDHKSEAQLLLTRARRIAQKSGT